MKTVEQIIAEIERRIADHENTLQKSTQVEEPDYSIALDRKAELDSLLKFIREDK